MKEHLKLLGFKVRDVITGFEGTVTQVSFDLSGRITAHVQSYQIVKGRRPYPETIDTKNLQPLASKSRARVPLFKDAPPPIPRDQKV